MNERDTKMAEALGLSDYRLVYQSGRQNVFCDGQRHAWTNGGYTELAPMNHIIRIGKCDCDRWKQDWNQ